MADLVPGRRNLNAAYFRSHQATARLRGEIILGVADESLTEPSGCDPDYSAVTLKGTIMF